MSNLVKILIVAAISVVLLFAAIIGGGLYWLKKHSGEYLEAGKNAIEEGARFGQTVDSETCVDNSLARYKQNPGLSDSIRTGLFLRGCLEKSRPTPGFCDKVPPQSELMKSVGWRLGQCQKAGINDNYCQQIVGQVQEYCHPGEKR